MNVDPFKKKKKLRRSYIADGFWDHILASASGFFHFPHGLFTCIQPKPTRTWWVDIKHQNILSLAYRFCIHYADICLESLHIQLTSILPSHLLVQGEAWGPNGSWGTEFKQGCQTCVVIVVVAESCPSPYWGHYSFTEEYPGWAEVKYFAILPQICAYRSISAFLAPWPKPAGGWYIHRHTCWARVGGLITGWKNDMVNQSRCYNWMRRGPAVQCACCLKTQRSHCDLI